VTTDEPIRVTGRPMSGQLQAALDQVGARDRAMIAAAFQTQQGRTGPLLRALALELQLAGLREYEVITAAEADLADEDERPFPAVADAGFGVVAGPGDRAVHAASPGRSRQWGVTPGCRMSVRYWRCNGSSAATPLRPPIRAGPGYAAGAVALRPGPPTRLFIRHAATPPDGECPPRDVPGLRVARARRSDKEPSR